MVPVGFAIADFKAGFPRASGDGPVEIGMNLRSDRFPPRERGWSLGYRQAAQAQGVSPARAGMVPVRLAAKRRTTCFPRASGDGPSPKCISSLIVKFPPRERGWSRG